MTGAVRAQVTGYWATTFGGEWNVTARWSNNVIPNAVGDWAWLTGNNNLGGGFGGTPTITQNMDVTLGYVFLGDVDRGTAIRWHGDPGRTLTFNTSSGSDGIRALLSKGSGDLHQPGVAGKHFNIGNDGDWMNVGIRVDDPDGLYIENFYNLTLLGGNTNSRALDAQGRDIVKAEDGLLTITRVVTNVNNFYVRDGRVVVNLEGNTGANTNYATRPDITNIVIGVAPGVLDRGEWHPLNVQTNIGEGTAQDRYQVPYFQITGDNDTNATASPYLHPYNVTLNRGSFRTFSRPLLADQANWTNHIAVYTGTWTLNGDAREIQIYNEVQDNGSLTSNVRQQVWSGTLTGPGGFTKAGSSEMTLIGTNDFQGAIIATREFDRGRGRYGSIGLRMGGILTDSEGIRFDRIGSIYLDNKDVNINDRLPDDFYVVNRNWGRFEIRGNPTESTTETIGSVTNLGGTLFLVMDLDDAQAQSMTLNLGSLVRTSGSIVQIHVKDVLQGALHTNAGAVATVNLLDGGASLQQVGGGGGVGAVNRSLALGVFGGDASDISFHDNSNVDPLALNPTRADQFMTVDNGRLRTLRDDEMVHLGDRQTNFLAITQADAATDANVNLAYRATVVYLNTSTNGPSGSLNMIKNRILGDVTWNALRTGIATNEGTTAANQYGAAVLLDHGARLTLESGMLLAGRDTRSSRGDDAAGIDVWLARGILDLDGTNNNREAIIQVANGHALYVLSRIEARNGLTKGGENSLVLQGANAISGTVSVTRGGLYLRHPEALGGATQVVLSADGALRLQFGGSFNAADLAPQAQISQRAFLYSESSVHNQWNGRIILNNVDEAGTLYHPDMAIVVGENAQNAVLTLAGDIAADSASASSDIVLYDPVRLTTGSSGGILNLKGRVGDRFVNGVAMPIDPAGATDNRVHTGDITNRIASENSALRFRIDGPSLSNFGDELAVHIYRPWRATGRIFAEQGTIRFLGDPAAGEGEFWDPIALTNANFANGMSGFQLGGPGTDAGGSVTLLLTRDGQVFNAERWTAATDNTNNTVTIGLEHFGANNATVTIGNTYNDGSPAGEDNRITMDRAVRFFAHNGYDSASGMESTGRVNIVQTLRGNVASRFVKVGSGQVWLQGPDNASYSEGNDISGFVLLGGELVLDRSPGSSANLSHRRTRDNGAQLVLAGGDLTFHGSANSSFATELLNSNLLVRPGESVIRVRPAGPTQSNLLHVANFAGSTVTRQTGGTVHMIFDTELGGGAGLLFGQTPNSRIGSWAVFSSNTTYESLTWAKTQIGSVYVEPFTGYTIDFYGAASYHTEVRDGTPSLNPSEIVGSLRFDTNLYVNLDLGGSELNIADGGILVTRGSGDGFGGPQGIANGTLGSQSGELIIHNYAPYGFNISAAITGPVHLTHSGISTTYLSSANTFGGRVYHVGGVLPVNSLSQLGAFTAAGTNTIALLGGVLQVTDNLNFLANTVEVGGDGGRIWVAADRAATFGGRILSEPNFFPSTTPLQNNGHGDLIKTGPGALVIAGHSNVVNSIQGLIDIRQGSIVINRPANTNDVLFGTSHSYYDGIVIRNGGSLVISNLPFWTGSARITTDIRDWLTLEQGSRLEVWDRDTTSYQTWRWNAPIHFAGDATIYVSGDELNINPDAGYLEGSGNLIKEGDGRLTIFGFSPDYTGAIVLQDGYLDINVIHQNLLPNVSKYVIGYSANENRGIVNLNVRPERANVVAETVISQKIEVLGESEDTAIGLFRPDHNDSVRFTGDIDLVGFDTYNNLREFRLKRWEENVSGGRQLEGGDSFDERSFIWLEGSIIGTNKRIRTLVQQSYSPNNLPNTMNNPTNLQMKAVWTFSGTNDTWLGTLELGNRQGTDATWQGQDSDKEHYVRFGRNDGNPTPAISSNVVVVLRHDAHLQAFGSQVTIGTLFTDGRANNVTVDYFGSDLTTNSFIENAGTQPGSFRICQFTNATISATIRDGTYWSPTEKDQPAAALSIYKDGPATLTLLASNSFSGLARVMSGTLALSGTGSIRNAHTIQIDAGATLDATPRTDGTLSLAAGQTLQGHGTVNGGLIAEAGSFVKPGTSPGTLTVTGDVTFESGSTFEVELLGTLSGQWDQILMTGVYEVTLNGATLSVLAPNPLTIGYVFPIIENWGSIDSSTFSGLPDGTTFVAGANTFQINYGTLPGYADDVTLTVIPEPSTLGLVGMIVAAVLLRRRLR